MTSIMRCEEVDSSWKRYLEGGDEEECEFSPSFRFPVLCVSQQNTNGKSRLDDDYGTKE